MTTRTTRTSTRTTPTRTPTTPTSRALERVIEPLSAERFLSSYWEHAPYVAGRGEAGRFDDLLSEADVEHIVCSTGLRYPAFRLVKEGERLDVRDYTEEVPWRPAPFSGTADVDRVLAEFGAGATIVLQALHLTWQPLAVFCRELERTLGHPAQANAYYTPRSSQGLPVHHDTHDVFSLQIAGEKRWLVYAPVLPLPLKDQRYRPELGRPGELVDDVTLSPGDTLYLPRGWLHEATTSDKDSLHITVGVNVYTWRDALAAALAECADEDVAFRRALAPEDGRPGPELIERLRARLSPADLARRQRDRFVRTRRPIRDGQIGVLQRLDSLTLDTQLERRPTVVAEVRAAGNELTLVFEGKTIGFPPHARGEVEHAVFAQEPFRARDLPGELDDEGRLVLVRRLVREGFLRFRLPGGPDATGRRGDADAPDSPRST